MRAGVAVGQGGTRDTADRPPKSRRPADGASTPRTLSTPGRRLAAVPLALPVHNASPLLLGLVATAWTAFRVRPVALKTVSIW